jgi:hypothetical protein
MPARIEISYVTPLRVILEQACPPLATYNAVFTFQSGQFTVKGENMSATMQVGTYATLSVTWKDKGGNPVKVDGPTVWVSSAPDVCAVEVATGNPQIANLHAAGPIGTATIQATADADLGEGVKSVTSSIQIEVISGEAVGGEIEFTQNTGQGGGGSRKR